MHIKINGESREISEGVTLIGLLRSLGVEPGAVAVQRNGDVLDRACFGVTELTHGDMIEVIRCVAGG